MKTKILSKMLWAAAVLGALAVMLLTSPSPASAAGPWLARYYKNTWLGGQPVLTQYEAAINYDWGTESPHSLVPTNNFSARWRNWAPFNAGWYRFTLTADDGARLYVDGEQIIGQWHNQPPTTYTVDRRMTNGYHLVVLEYYESVGGAVAKLDWAPTGAPSGSESKWTASYFPNRFLWGSPKVVREESAINFKWGSGSPHGSIPGDGFSARFERTMFFEAGKYRFTTTTDDGVRLYVDSQRVIDQWRSMSGESHSAVVKLGKGAHEIRMEYYEQSGDASARLSWELLPSSNVGNIITCVRPSNSWIKVYRLDNGKWVDTNPRGLGANDSTGYLKIDGLTIVDQNGVGNPYWVELWADGSLIRSVGNTARGEPEFRVYSWQDNYTPWGCPAP